MLRVILWITSITLSMGACAQLNPFSHTLWKIDSVDAGKNYYLQKMKWQKLGAKFEFDFIQFLDHEHYHDGKTCFGTHGAYKIAGDSLVEFLPMGAYAAQDCEVTEMPNGVYRYSTKEKQLILRPVKEIAPPEEETDLGHTEAGLKAEDTACLVGAIPQPERFEKLTVYELRRDSLTEKHNHEKIARMRDGTAFKKGVPKKEQQQMLAHELATQQTYRDNRSRYFIKRFINDKEDKEFLADTDTLTTECTCYLSNDTIKIKMGLWVFGGLGLNVLIHKNNFKSAYWEDEHEQNIYKTMLSQTELSDNIFVENERAQLILQNQPIFTAGEMISGYLRFKTKEYFISADYHQGFAADSYSDAKMNSAYTQGEVYFKCRLRNKTWEDE